MIEPRSARRSGFPNRAIGFTLLEVMIVVAIVAILSAIAYPSYLSYKVRANRAAAQTVLMDVANRQQQYFLDARQYAPDLTTLQYGTIPSEVSPYYAISTTAVNNATPPTYNVTATPSGGTMQANDGTLTVTSAGTKTRGTLLW
jgi:type IV pilus assembly protein PilE